MTPLRQRMMQELQLRGYSERTVQAYLHPVAQLARHYHTAPDLLTQEQVRDYLIHLSTVQKVSRSTHTIALCGIKFFYQHTLGREWKVFEIARPRAEKKLPAVLSRNEVARILATVRIPVYRVCLSTIYTCGLRLLEGAQLQVPDIDGDRKLVHVHHGKGALDRYVPLPEAMLTLLRAFWRTHRNPLWLFPLRRRAAARHPVPSRAPACRAPSYAPSASAVSASRRTCTRCGTATPRTCSKRASRCS